MQQATAEIASKLGVRADGTAADRGRAPGSEPRPTPADVSRPPESISKGVVNAQTYLGGEDTVDISLYVEWDENEWENTVELLDSCKYDAQREDGDRGIFDLGGWQFQVLPNGSGSRSGILSSFIVNGLGMQFKFTKSRTPKGTTPNARVHIGSLPLIVQGLDECWRQAKDVIAGLGGEILENKVSRVDSCVDLPDVPMETFVKPLLAKHYTCRARGTSFHMSLETINSFAIGKEPLCRIYDKALEQTERNNPEKFAAMVQNRWNGVVPETAARIEWQLRRETLKEFGINTIEDWKEKRTGVFRYLFDWLRFIDAGDREFDRRNPERFPTLPIWETALEAFKHWGGQSDSSVARAKAEKGKASPALLRNMIGGCGMSIIAQTWDHWHGLGNFIDQLVDEFKQWISERDEGEIVREFYLRMCIFRSKVPPKFNRTPNRKAKFISAHEWRQKDRDNQELVREFSGEPNSRKNMDIEFDPRTLELTYERQWDDFNEGGEQ
ncbi:hypothetical protein C5Y93_22945 [Blastopirellula marina]|uniref:Replication initiation factor n=1 Tax=Blastopirellula marina TaxID=124 RepID=A0A2S8GHM3_9BACT|nr:hypothetical protein C5Y93_22945 [Blastopirellula marina]